jgi:hypothetical protein
LLKNKNKNININTNNDAKILHYYIESNNNNYLDSNLNTKTNLKTETNENFNNNLNTYGCKNFSNIEFDRGEILIKSLRPPKKLKKILKQKKNYYSIIDTLSKEIDINQKIEKDKDKDKEKINNNKNLYNKNNHLLTINTKNKIINSNIHIKDFNDKDNDYYNNDININLKKYNPNPNLYTNTNTNTNSYLNTNCNTNINISTELYTNSPLSFFDKFKKKCSKDVKGSIKLKKQIKKDKKKKLKINNDVINIFREKKNDEKSKAIDKEVYFMDGNSEPKDKILILYSVEGKDKKPKYLYEDKNNPSNISDNIANLNDKFAYKCKKFLNEKYIENMENRDNKYLKNIQEIDKFVKKHLEYGKNHEEIKLILNDIEKINLLSLRRADNILKTVI